MASGWARRLAVVAVLCCAMAPPGAQAQEPGVHIDPQSPAGTEYALPLVQARGDNAAPRSGGSTGGGSAAQPGAAPARFGAGIGDGKNDGGSSGGGRPRHRTAPGRGGAAAPPRDIATAAAQPDSTSPVIAGLAGLVLLAGLGLGLLLRRRSHGG